METVVSGIGAWALAGELGDRPDATSLLYVMGSTIVFGIAVPAVIAFLAWRVRFDTVPAAEATPGAPLPAGAGLARPRPWFWSVIAWGSVLPLLTGLWVWIDLSAAGKPVLDINPMGKDWDQLLSLAGYMAYAMVIFGSPYFIFAFFLRSKLRRSAADPATQTPVLLWSIASGLLALSVTMALIMNVLWRSPEMMGFLIFLFPFYVLAPAAITTFAGMKAGEVIGKRITQPRGW